MFKAWAGRATLILEPIRATSVLLLSTFAGSLVDEHCYRIYEGFQTRFFPEGVSDFVRSGPWIFLRRASYLGGSFP